MLLITLAGSPDEVHLAENAELLCRDLDVLIFFLAISATFGDVVI